MRILRATYGFHCHGDITVYLLSDLTLLPSDPREILHNNFCLPSCVVFAVWQVVTDLEGASETFTDIPLHSLTWLIYVSCDM
jgi:hypothetical protein